MNLNFKSFGAGQPVIILHGFLGMLDNWQTFGKELADKGYEVFLLDQRNHGKSPHAPELSYELMAQDVAEWMQSQNILTAHVIGHSMGGKTAMKLALAYPQLVDSLVVVDIAPRAYEAGHMAILNALVGTDLADAKTRGEIEDALMYRLGDLSVVRFLMKNLSRDRDKGFVWKMNLPVLVENYYQINRNIESESTYTGPSLFARGELSGYVTDEDLEGIRTLFPKAQLITVPGAGHWVHADNPEFLFLKVIDFFQKSRD